MSVVARLLLELYQCAVKGGKDVGVNRTDWQYPVDQPPPWAAAGIATLVD
jgi:hypothetical protein